MCMKTATISPAFSKHEHDDQQPPEVTLEVEVVDKIGRRAENEQQSPDLEIDAERMLLPFDVMLSAAAAACPGRGWCCPSACAMVLSHQR